MRKGEVTGKATFSQYILIWLNQTLKYFKKYLHLFYYKYCSLFR